VFAVYIRNCLVSVTLSLHTLMGTISSSLSSNRHEQAKTVKVGIGAIASELSVSINNKNETTPIKVRKAYESDT
jgi:hypothetical protein